MDSRSLVIAFLALAIGCDAGQQSPASPTDPSEAALPADIGDDVVQVAESWTSSSWAEDIDSLAAWSDEEQHLVFATAKQGNRLVVLDAGTGEEVGSIGRRGEQLGELQRPNGVAIAGDLLYVVERDNHRVQVFSLPGFEPLSAFGETILRRPYGIAARRQGQTTELFITDNYETPDETIPPDSELGERIKHFRVDDQAQPPTAQLVGSFGETAGQGVLRKVETIALDNEAQRLLVAEESEDDMSLKVYGLGGEFLGIEASELFRWEPEGIAAIDCQSESYWITTDQHETRTVFRVLRQADLSLVGSFAGKVTANTDGIATSPKGPTLFAVHDDQAVSAFAWSHISSALGLGPTC